MESGIVKMMEKHMRTGPASEESLTLNPHITYSGDRGCLLKSPRGYRRAFGSLEAPGLHTQLCRLSDGVTITTQDLHTALARKKYPEKEITDALFHFWQHGILVSPEWAELETAT